MHFYSSSNIYVALCTACARKKERNENKNKNKQKITQYTPGIYRMRPLGGRAAYLIEREGAGVGWRRRRAPDAPALGHSTNSTSQSRNERGDIWGGLKQPTELSPATQLTVHRAETIHGIVLKGSEGFFFFPVYNKKHPPPIKAPRRCHVALVTACLLL